MSKELLAVSVVITRDSADQNGPRYYYAAIDSTEATPYEGRSPDEALGRLVHELFHAGYAPVTITEIKRQY